MPTAAGQPSFQRFRGGFHELRRLRGDLRGGMEGVQVRDVAVTRFRLVKVLAPFHDLSVLSYADRRQLGKRVPDRVEAFVVRACDLVRP